MEQFDLAVIGAGPGGYVAAIRGAQRGMRVVCIEKENTLGGTCLNVGCIPSKALLHSSEYYHRVAHQGKEHGIHFESLTYNLHQMMERKKNIVAGLTQGIFSLFKKNQITSIQGEAKLISPTSIQVKDQIIQAHQILLATGSEPIPLSFLPFDEKQILSSTGALSLSSVPQKMLIVGAGVIGLELGSVYRRLGTEIEVVELLDRVAPGMDREISRSVEHILSKQGFTFHLKTKVTGGKIERGRVKLALDQKEIEADVVLVCIGRRPYTQNLGLESVGVKKDPQGRIVIDQNFRTSVPTIYAIGDVVDGPMLAHKASTEAVAAVDIMAQDTITINYLAIPNVMYTWPEVASVGMSEEEARQAGLDLQIGKVPFKAVPRARCSADTEGFVKILGDQKTGRILGLHIIGPNASELIQEGVIALEKKMTLHQLSQVCYAHPTSSEAIKEAALAAQGISIH